MKHTIVGAGIGGLTLALALEKKGIEYQLFERAPELSAVGAGIWLAPNALQVLEQLDILDAIKKHGNSIDQITLAKANLTPISDSFQDNIKKKFGYSTIAIERAKLQKILLEQIPQHKIHLGKTFVSAEPLNHEKIIIHFDDQSSIETDYLIGADGIHSTVRKHLFPDSKTRYSGQTCWRGLAEMSLDTDFQNRGIELWGDQVRFGLSKVAKNTVYWFAVALDKPNQKDESDSIQEKLLKQFASFHPLMNQLIKATPQNKIFRNDIHDLQPLDNWYKGNICLIGDAGHATTPNMGQGGAQAIEDAYYLSHLIATHPHSSVFESFQAKRQSKVNKIVKQSWTTGKLAHWKYGKGIRNFLLKSIPKKTLESKMIDMYRIDSLKQ